MIGSLVCLNIHTGCEHVALGDGAVPISRLQWNVKVDDNLSCKTEI